VAFAFYTTGLNFRTFPMLPQEQPDQENTSGVKNTSGNTSGVRLDFLLFAEVLSAITRM
jgi:hypothetical protein